jgi:hypothetical protein
MVFPIVASPDPQGQWFVQTWICIISGSFDVNLSFSGFVVPEKICRWPDPILHFCDYFPFEEDLALDLYNFILSLPKDDLYQVWLKLACWFWRRWFLKNFSVFLLFHCYLPLGKGLSIICTILNPLCPRMICANFGWNWPSVSREEVKIDRRQTTGDQKSSLALSAQVS